MKRVSCAVVLLFAVSCASAPPNLSKQGTQAFYGTRVIKGLDLLRDTAVSANAQVPPLVSEAVTRQVVLYHKSALNIINTVPEGWKPVVLSGLDELLKNLSPAEAQLLAPYVALVKTVIQEVTSGPQARVSRNRGSASGYQLHQRSIQQETPGCGDANGGAVGERLPSGARFVFGEGRKVAGSASGRTGSGFERFALLAAAS